MPTIEFMISMPLVRAMMMAVTMDVIRTFHPFMAAITKNTRPTTMPMTPIHSMVSSFDVCYMLSAELLKEGESAHSPPLVIPKDRPLQQLSRFVRTDRTDQAISLRVARMSATLSSCFMRNPSRRMVPSSKDVRSSGPSNMVPRSPRC